jgi:hypothetical protein
MRPEERSARPWALVEREEEKGEGREGEGDMIGNGYAKGIGLGDRTNKYDEARVTISVRKCRERRVESERGKEGRPTISVQSSTLRV